MNQGSTVLQFLRRRIRAYQDLRQVLQEQRQALVANDIAQTQDFSQKQLALLEQINECESSWREYLKKHIKGDELPKSYEACLEMLRLSEKSERQARRLYAQLRTILEELAELKQTNQMLMESSLAFVQTLLSNITGKLHQQGVYQPGRKSPGPSALLNKRL